MPKFSYYYYDENHIEKLKYAPGIGSIYLWCIIRGAYVRPISSYTVVDYPDINFWPEYKK
jgi:hypothetical protein